MYNIHLISPLAKKHQMFRILPNRKTNGCKLHYFYLSIDKLLHFPYLDKKINMLLCKVEFSLGSMMIQRTIETSQWVTPLT